MQAHAARAVPAIEVFNARDLQPGTLHDINSDNQDGTEEDGLVDLGSLDNLGSLDMEVEHTEVPPLSLYSPASR